MKSLTKSDAWKEFVKILGEEKRELGEKIVDSYGNQDDELTKQVQLSKAISELIRKPQKIVDSAKLSDSSARIK
jgi:hypothetical protein